MRRTATAPPPPRRCPRRTTSAACRAGCPVCVVRIDDQAYVGCETMDGHACSRARQQDPQGQNSLLVKRTSRPRRPAQSFPRPRRQQHLVSPPSSSPATTMTTTTPATPTAAGSLSTGKGASLMPVWGGLRDDGAARGALGVRTVRSALGGGELTDGRFHSKGSINRDRRARTQGSVSPGCAPRSKVGMGLCGWRAHTHTRTHC